MLFTQLLFLLAAGSGTLASSLDDSDNLRPTLENARKNGPQIFNAIHNAMREFGSAWHHNGMALFPAVVPEGVILHHGEHSKEVPKNLEWLAFEVEHAENFARPLLVPNSKPNSPEHDTARLALRHQEPLGVDSQHKELTGYLQIYQANRPLNLLYFDGMSAGKTLGTGDSQDCILLGDTDSPEKNSDMERADSLCKLAKEWDIDGFIRMEIGFEIVYCNFSSGLDLISVNERARLNDTGHISDDSVFLLEWARAASQRYHGIGASRVLLDYSSIVSAYFYDINMTNPDLKHPELPRLVNTPGAQLQVMKDHVAGLLKRSRLGTHRSIDWQGVTDMIVARYAQRLALLAETDSLHVHKMEINNLLNLYIDYSKPDSGFAAAKQRCSKHYLQPVKPQTPEDHLVHAAIEHTTTEICTALFKIRELVIGEPQSDQSSVDAAKKVSQNLLDILSWSEWKECGPCKYDEVCFIAMFPFGNREDHFHPSCANMSGLIDRRRHTYWFDDWILEECEGGISCLLRGDEDSKREEL